MNIDNFCLGYFKLSRSILQSKVFKNEKWFKVFVWCIGKANHSIQQVLVKTGRGETVITVHPGQFIFGRNIAAKELDMKPSTVRNIMLKLETFQNITTQKDSHYTLVTVCNYKDYQFGDNYEGQAKGQPKDNQRTTKGQPKDTNNNEKNEKNGENEKNNTSKKIIESLNKFAGTNYRYKTSKTQSLIKARMTEGYSTQDFFTVIRKKCKEWKGTEHEKFLRPETLFGNKFEGYLNQNITNKPQQQNKKHYQGNIHQQSQNFLDQKLAEIEEEEKYNLKIINPLSGGKIEQTENNHNSTCKTTGQFP